MPNKRSAGRISDALASDIYTAAKAFKDAAFQRDDLAEDAARERLLDLLDEATGGPGWLRLHVEAGDPDAD